MATRTAKLSLVYCALLSFIWMGISGPLNDPNALTSQNNSEILKKQPPKDAHTVDLSDSELEAYLLDPHQRVDPLFRIPKELKEDTFFWFKIYAKYSFYQTLIYDKNHPHIIYRVVDNRELFQKGKSAVTIELTSKQRVRQALGAYQSALSQLQNNPYTKFAKGSAGAHLLKIWGRKKSEEWRQIQASIRTQAGQRDRIMQGIKNADPFFKPMESIFEKFGLPTQLTRLPLVESSFDLRAYSKANAVGVWQFLERSAQEYIVVDKKNGIDERKSPIKATYAAAKMFKRNYRLLGDYALAVIAYNHGPKNLIPLRKSFSGKNIGKLLTMKTKTPLGYASRSYYCEFLALLHAERYRDQIYGFPMESPSPYGAVSIIRIKKSASIFELASSYGISIHELKLLNPDIFDLKRKLPVGTKVVIPKRIVDSIVDADTQYNDDLDQVKDSASERGIASE